MVSITAAVMLNQSVAGLVRVRLTAPAPRVACLREPGRPELRLPRHREPQMGGAGLPGPRLALLQEVTSSPVAMPGPRLVLCRWAAASSPVALSGPRPVLLQEVASLPVGMLLRAGRRPDLPGPGLLQALRRQARSPA